MTLTEILLNTKHANSKITKIYHGKDHYCRCGCGGKYFLPGEKGFTRAINAMSKSDFKPVKIEPGNTYVNITTDDFTPNGYGTCYCLYFD